MRFPTGIHCSTDQRRLPAAARLAARLTTFAALRTSAVARFASFTLRTGGARRFAFVFAGFLPGVFAQAFRVVTALGGAFG